MGEMEASFAKRMLCDFSTTLLHVIFHLVEGIVIETIDSAGSLKDIVVTTTVDSGTV